MMDEPVKPDDVDVTQLKAKLAECYEETKKLTAKCKVLEETVAELRNVNYDISKLLNRYAMALLGLTEKFATVG